MKRTILTARLALLLAVVFGCVRPHAQIPVPVVTVGDSLAWDMKNVPSLEVAQGATYRLYVDVGTGGLVLAGVTCTGTVQPFTCRVPLPDLGDGQHELRLTAQYATTETVKSEVLIVAFMAVLAVPANLRIQR